MALPFKRLKNLSAMLDFKDTDIIVAEDDDTTRKATIYQLIKYIKNHTEINSYFAHSDLIGNKNGVATLDENGKVQQLRSISEKQKILYTTVRLGKVWKMPFLKIQPSFPA